ncbi:MAG TPA: high-potential iron-sulfur protein [Steroidobacteraceae bacterium]|jgi:hypothetical protein|nr:high-potential iron-sulfur protein [Steroidobacteraceae bacterium]
MNNANDRRRFLDLCAGAFAASLVVKGSRAAELPHVAPDDPTASALGYVEDAAKLEPQKAQQHKPGQTCGNCRQFTRQPGSEYGPCLIFSGKSVNEKGWCAAYVAKA